MLALSVAQAHAQDGSTTVASEGFGTPMAEILGQEPLWARPSLSFYGTPGLIDMPGAWSLADGEGALSASNFDGNLRLAFTFQLSPRLSGTFRYSVLDKFDKTINRYDRSFDIRYQIAEEGDLTPAVAVGLQDFGGTGVYAGEYLTFGKTFDRLRVTGGIGWGRFGSYNGFSNPLGVLSDSLKSRPAHVPDINETGKLDTGNWFRGDAALFGGLQYQLNDKVVLTAEYSSDDYEAEAERMGFEHNSPFNFGVSYRLSKSTTLTGAYLYGSALGVALQYTFNGKYGPYPGGVEPAAPPVLPRDQAAALGWRLDGSSEQVRARVKAGLEKVKIQLQGYEQTSPSSVRVYILNPTYDAVPEAIGRTARVLTNTLPPQIETFDIVPVGNGLSLSSVTIRRSDMEQLEFDFDSSWKMYSRARIADAADEPMRRDVEVPGTYPDFSYGLGTYVTPAYFDPDAPIRVDAGLAFNMAYVPLRNVILSTQLRYAVVGNRADGADRSSNSVLPHVRSDAALYAKESTIQMNHLTAEYFYRPGRDLYGRVTAGYLEDMFAGVSTEVLWKPVSGPLALGAEINYVQQRDYDMGFGLMDYKVATGHVSAYYDWGNGYMTEVDAGRYLAGDWGATFSLDREFANGFRIGAFFTKTDVSAEDFGEGSFDKGIRFWIPLSRVAGEPSMSGFGQTIRPLTRDGGQRLNIRNRLYDTVRDYHDPELQEDWGRFWR
ncbi:YjbH domain-containing protein [Pseudooceanicola sp. CBS1P-1]|uniref:YjbH domain-containing protein n=1 Tax=Pseudooceanicola albus TaxID=2692189 RepID=A0A6L7G9S4_9RHOB|nr:MULTISPECIES: YjbH domain-containing protein [Pseudooceanicola]MBT9386722.1 YjbH domain-containing protein [Pseudooceanicola endophyticus]MXN20795.1 YjbH domain-containing protein [Pseudooceanicola albus]